MTDTARRQAKVLHDPAEVWMVRFPVEVQYVVSIKVIMFKFSPFAPGDRQSRHQ